ncbi:homeobox protein CDX-1b isoform X1 [Alosa sapidissima]|uniref:homeobox protein CDX-1b isoform X1 n=1 Tax=Alosa sapidissima TaxID=34773 RepID=UPI001C08006A|nr:homeobox protein CDX-1b isoform X1 [Alosa sapidissima]
MYVSYLLDKDPSMYSNTVRHPSLNLNHQNFVPAPPQYTDFTGYHHVPGINNDLHHSQAGTWNPAYAPPREEWPPYGAGTTPSTSNPGQISFTPPDFSPVQPPGLLPPSINASVGQLSPNSQRRNPYDWMRRSAPPSNPDGTGGKTRTKDKYRVVYTDHQRLELEKEFHYSRYITIRRKAELATSLSLSERQVKIWFQNRRAKERKVNKKKMQQSQPASTTTPTPPGSTMPGNVAMVTSSSGGLVSPPMPIKQEY